MKKIIFAVIMFFGFMVAMPLHGLVLKSEVDEIYVGGQTIGLKLNIGVTVSGTYGVQNGTELIKPWQEAKIMEGDTITSIDDVRITKVDELLAALANSKGEVLTLEIVRGTQTLKKKVKPVKKNNTYSLGLYVKDNILGVGTLTYIVPGVNIYGSLGHQIQHDKQINGGTVYKAEVIGVDKGVIGHAGSKKATIKSETLGTVEKNTFSGVHGIYNGDVSKFTKMKIAKRDQVKKGKAHILTCINGYQVKKYEIEITQVETQKSKDVKGIKFAVVDEELLKTTGGIIQGMSGSPIIQDNQIIGAVTHVLVNHPNQGYGIFIEFMLGEMDVIVE